MGTAGSVDDAASEQDVEELQAAIYRSERYGRVMTVEPAVLLALIAASMLRDN